MSHHPQSAKKRVDKMGAKDLNEPSKIEFSNVVPSSSDNAVISHIDNFTTDTINKTDVDPSKTFKTPSCPAPKSVKKKTNTAKKQLTGKVSKVQVKRVKQSKVPAQLNPKPSQNISLEDDDVSALPKNNTCNSPKLVKEFASDEEDEILEVEPKQVEEDPDYDPDDRSYPSNARVTSMFGIDIKRVMDDDTTGIENRDKELLPEAPCYYCGLCEFTTVQDPDIRGHWDNHVTKNELNCRQCDYIGRDFAEMAAHRYEHHPPEYEHTVCCLQCPKKFVVGRIHKLLEFHYRQCHLHKKGGWCRVCGKELETFKSWKAHEKGHVNPYYCDHCGRTYTSNIGFRQHLAQLGGVVHCCETCGMYFKRSRNLKEHIKSLHTTSELKCEHCDLIISTPNKLNYHLLTHQKKTCICDTCGAAFYTTSNLREHQILHSDERPYTCDSCGRKYKRKPVLKTHMKSHMGVQPHKCPKCGKCFSTKRLLRRHDGMHSGIRIVKCMHDQCDRTFNDKSAMMKHYKSVHE